MPSAPKPKTFVAAVPFSYAGRRYRKGEPVTNQAHIAHLVKWGSRFIAHKTAKAETSAEPPKDAAAPNESPKED